MDGQKMTEVHQYRSWHLHWTAKLRSHFHSCTKEPPPIIRGRTSVSLHYNCEVHTQIWVMGDDIRNTSMKKLRHEPGGNARCSGKGTEERSGKLAFLDTRLCAKFYSPPRYSTLFISIPSIDCEINHATYDGKEVLGDSQTERIDEMVRPQKNTKEAIQQRRLAWQRMLRIKLTKPVAWYIVGANLAISISQKNAR